MRSLLDQLCVGWEVRTGRRHVDVLFLGDSLTELWLHPGTGRRAFSEAFGSWQPAAFGVGGDRCAHLRWRVSHGILEGLRPRLVVLCIGANQLARRYAVIRTIDEILGVANEVLTRLPGSRLLLSSVLPQDPGWDWNPLGKIAEINDGLRAHRLPRTTFVDVSDAFAADNAIRREMFTDGIHLTRAGYRAWADALRPHVSCVLGPPTARSVRLPGPGPLMLRLRDIRARLGLQAR